METGRQLAGGGRPGRFWMRGVCGLRSEHVLSADHEGEDEERIVQHEASRELHDPEGSTHGDEGELHVEEPRGREDGRIALEEDPELHRGGGGRDSTMRRAATAWQHLWCRGGCAERGERQSSRGGYTERGDTERGDTQRGDTERGSRAGGVGKGASGHKAWRATAATRRMRAAVAPRVRRAS